MRGIEGNFQFMASGHSARCLQTDRKQFIVLYRHMSLYVLIYPNFSGLLDRAPNFFYIRRIQQELDKKYPNFCKRHELCRKTPRSYDCFPSLVAGFRTNAGSFDQLPQPPILYCLLRRVHRRRFYTLRCFPFLDGFCLLSEGKKKKKEKKL